MRVLYLTPGCFDKGGISRYSRYQIRALRALHGHRDVRALSLFGPTEASFEDIFNVRWHADGNGPLEKARFAARVLRETLVWRPEVIHVAHVHMAGLAVAIAGWRRTTTVVNTYGHEVWSGLRHDAAWGLRRASFVISDCHFTATFLVNEARFRNESPSVIWDCVDLARFTPGKPRGDVLQRYGIPDPEKHLIVMTLGRLATQAAHKGYDRLLRAYSTVADATPSSRLVLAGGGDLRDSLADLAEELGVQRRVIFTGSIDEPDLPDVYRAATVFSLVSDRGPGRGEGLPLTPLEAMACGVPILVGNQDGSTEAVQDGVNGFTVAPFDLDAHANFLQRILSRPDLRTQLSRGAVRMARSRFSFEGFLAKHWALYERIGSE